MGRRENVGGGIFWRKKRGGGTMAIAIGCKNQRKEEEEDEECVREHPCEKSIATQETTLHFFYVHKENPFFSSPHQ